MQEKYIFLAVCVIVSIITALAATYAFGNLFPKSNEQKIAEFYSTETAVSVSPSDYISDLNSGKVDGLLVDLRSTSEYDSGHLITAISVPAVEMNRTQLVHAFSKLPKDKPIITYCYSEYCTLSREVGEALAENGIYAKHFTAGWYEIKRDFSQYIVNGTGAGDLSSLPAAAGSTCSANGNGTFHC